MSRDHAVPGSPVPGWTCGKRIESGGYCGKPVVYEIRFAGWESGVLAGACAEHAVVARQEFEVEAIWSVAR